MSININKINAPNYYHREYKNDVPKMEEVQPVKEKTLLDDLQRVGMVALPFISLYKPLSLPISLGMGGLRVFSCSMQLIAAMQQGDVKDIGYQALQTTIAVIALAGTIFAHPLGMLITTTHDILLELYHLLENLQEGKYEQVVLNCANIVNNTLYLGLFMNGGLELGIASLAVQMCIGFYHSFDEFSKGNNLEAAGHILMGLIRSHQLSMQIDMVGWKNRIKAVTGNILGSALVAIEHNEKIESEENSLNAHSMSNKELAEILVKYGNNSKGYSAIAWATHLGHMDVVKNLINHGANFKDGIPNVGSLLNIAIINKHFQLAEFFIDQGLRVENPLVFLKDRIDNEIWDFLDKHKLFENYKTTTYLASFLQQNVPISNIQLLIEHGGNCAGRIDGLLPYSNKKLYPNCEMPGILTVAIDCKKNEPGFLKFLIEHGAPINTNLNYPAWNPFFQIVNEAAWSNNNHQKFNELVDYFIKKGAIWPIDSNKANIISVASSASRNGNLDLVILMSQICDCLNHSCVSIGNKDYNPRRPTDHNNLESHFYTLLQYAITQNRLEDVEKLLKSGADPNGMGAWNSHMLQVRHGLFSKSNLAIAVENKNTEIANLLLDYGAILD